MAQVILGRVKDGQIKIQRFFKKEYLKWEGKEIEITVVQGGKTQAQLGYFWGVVIPIISESTGFTKDEVYDVYRKKFCSYQKVHKGKVYEFTKGLSGMRVKEAAEFITKVVNHGRQDLGLVIPDPDPEFLYVD